MQASDQRDEGPAGDLRPGPLVRHALWVSCQDDGLDHLVYDDDMGRAISSADADGFRALCGRMILPAPMVCAPLPMCPRCVARRRLACHEQPPVHRARGTRMARHRSPGFVRKLLHGIHGFLASSSPVGRNVSSGERNPERAGQALPAAGPGSVCPRPRRVPGARPAAALPANQGQTDLESSLVKGGWFGERQQSCDGDPDHRWRRTTECAGVAPATYGESRTDHLPGESALGHRASSQAWASARWRSPDSPSADAGGRAACPPAAWPLSPTDPKGCGMRVLTQPTTWALDRNDDDFAHLRETCDGQPRLITSFDGPVPVAACGAWLGNEDASRTARRCPRCVEIDRAIGGLA